MIGSVATVIVTALAWFFGFAIDEDGRRQDAIQRAQRTCEPAAVQTYDVEGQAKLVYGCAPAYRIHTDEYGRNWFWFVP